MSLTLAQITGGVGAALGGLGCWGLAAPDGLRRAVDAFPRHKVAGWLLSILALVWSVYALQALSLGGLDVWKQRAFYAIPVAAYLIIVYLDELLAVRALGGLLLLLPTPWLAVARWSDSGWSYVPRVMAYAFVILGMYFVATPFRFRLWLTPCLAGPARTRACCGTLAALGLLHVLLAVAVF